MLIQKQVRFPGRRALSQPGAQHGISIGAQQDDAFLPPLATHAQPGRLRTLGWAEQILDLQRHHFADPQAAAPITRTRPHREGAVIACHNCSTVASLKSVLYLPAVLTRVPFEPRWIRPLPFTAVFGQKVEIGLERRHPPVDRGGLQPLWSLVVHEVVNVVHRDVPPGLDITRQKLAHIAEIVHDRGTVEGTVAASTAQTA